MTIKPYLQLVRLPNLFTAAADPLAGWLVATGTLAYPSRWVPLVAASVVIYAAGIVLNDVFDIEVDRQERPNRPLPSGRVPFRPAAWFGGVGLAIGPFVAALSGSAISAGVAGLLVLCVLAYNAGMKRTLLGPVVMGSCRSLNLLLGLSQIPDLGGRYAWLLAGSYGLFVVGMTCISRSEVETGQRRGIVLGTLIQCVALLGFFNGFANLAYMVDHGVRYRGYLGWGGIVWAAVSQVVLISDLRATYSPTPKRTQLAVKTGVLSLVWLDAAAVTGVEGPMLGLVVAALWFPAFFSGRWLYST